MRVRSRIDTLERRTSPTGKCGCNGPGWSEMMYCRDPSVPPPPPTPCARCGRPKSRLLVRMGEGWPGWTPPSIEGKPAYEPIGPGGIRRLMCGEDPCGPDPMAGEP